MTRRSNKPDEIEISQKLGNTSRNERQKSQLLGEVNRMRRNEIEAAVEEARQIVEASNELCKKLPENGKTREKAG
jgi:hypothetical protein